MPPQGPKQALDQDTQFVLNLTDNPEMPVPPVVKAPRSVAEWYRHIPQTYEIRTQDVETILGVARPVLAMIINQVEDTDGQPRFRIKDEFLHSKDEAGEIFTDETQPASMDIACMLLEAAFVSKDKTVSMRCFSIAETIFDEVHDDISRPAGVRVDACLMKHDLNFMRIIRKEEEGWYSPRDWKDWLTQYQEQHRSSIRELQELIGEYNGTGDYTEGKILELFWVVGNRHDELIHAISEGNQDKLLRHFFRGAYTREDRSKVTAKMNFDVAECIRPDPKHPWGRVETRQLGTSKKLKDKRKYDPRIRMVIFEGQGDRLKERFIDWSNMMMVDLDLLGELSRSDDDARKEHALKIIHNPKHEDFYEAMKSTQVIV